ncbi:hypothetical protein [Bordetella sp. LUAb4]|uniref:hypothetical protein n=1 Tax=Bordetella sp. LUAb4 TaxID=2843195 RepID=UPI001E4318CB|nr:hypothetical protein [Bordetella sp. LUAb4]
MPAPISGNSNALPHTDGVNQSGADSTPPRDAGTPVRATDGHPRASASLQPQPARSTVSAGMPATAGNDAEPAGYASASAGNRAATLSIEDKVLETVKRQFPEDVDAYLERRRESLDQLAQTRETASAAEASLHASTSSVPPPGSPSVNVNTPAQVATPTDLNDAIRARLETLATLAGQYEEVIHLQHVSAILAAKHQATINALEHNAMVALAHGRPDIAESVITQLYAVADECSGVPHLNAARETALTTADRLVQAVTSWREEDESTPQDVHP